MRDIRLSPLSAEHATRFEEMLAEYKKHDEIGLYTGFYEEAWHGFDAYRTMLERLSAGGWPRPEIVSGQTYFVLNGEAVVGEAYLRFGLTRCAKKRVATSGIRFARARVIEAMQRRDCASPSIA